MRLVSWLRRRFEGRRSPAAEDQARYVAADRLEKRTQDHYREVTGSDASGRPTRSKD